MNEDIKARWVARLRSGQDVQGKGSLRLADDTKCCLGVLCEIAVEDGVIDAPTGPGAWHRTYRYGPEEDTGVLPALVVTWAELESTSPVVLVGEDLHTTLVELNDDEDSSLTFPELADLIDAHL